MINMTHDAHADDSMLRVSARSNNGLNNVVSMHSCELCQSSFKKLNLQSKINLCPSCEAKLKLMAEKAKDEVSPFMVEQEVNYSTGYWIFVFIVCVLWVIGRVIYDYLNT